MKMTGQTRIIVFTAMALAATDIAVRLHQAPACSSGKVVSAQEFRLVDRSGNARAIMSIDGNNEPGIQLLDKNGEVRAQLDTWDSTPSLILNGANGQRRVYFGMDNESGGGILDMYKPNGAEAATLKVNGATPRFTLNGADAFNNTTWSVNAGTDTLEVGDDGLPICNR